MHSEELYTRCPTCKTVFRTHDAQLAMQSGKVRCGQCRMVFDGRAHLVDLAPAASSDTDDEAMQGPPTVMLRDSIALEPADTNEPGSDRSPHATDPGSDASTSTGEFSPSAQPYTSAPGTDALSRDLAEEIRAATAQADGLQEEIVPYDWHEPQPTRSRGVQWVLGIVALLLVLLLAGQALFHFRHVIAANYPPLRPNLVAACALLGCTIDAVRGRDEITIESHDLQADPAHQGLLILQVTLRNRATHPVAFPHLELEILDLGSLPQVRRAFAPVEYAGGAADFARGMPASSEWNVKFFLDASSISARGYNLDLFYP